MSDEINQNYLASSTELKTLSDSELEALCKQLRVMLIETVAKTGGHLSSNLGVVELTVALHRAFDLPHDQIVFDVGHQCYVHKLLTGRADRFDTLRQDGGISGFPSPVESELDTFIAGHSSTSVSAANGMAKAKALTGDDGYVIAVIGDGALTGGLAYEGLSNAGRSKDRLIVVLNDNRMSISRNVGFVARHLANLRARPHYIRIKRGFGDIVSHIPFIGNGLYTILLNTKTKLKNAMYRNSSMFEDMGFYYLGPINGHHLNDLDSAFETAKKINQPVLLHVETVKGRGYSFAMQSPDMYHGVSSFDLQTGQTPPCKASFSSVFGEEICELARDDQHICAITAAMKSGTCLNEFADKYPTRFFDVGIAEEHAVTFSSGLARNGILPIFAVYSTFLQRAYDQILNDTSIINHHIVLAIDRAGVVPDDGETHQGIFDVPFLNTIPHVTIYSPSCFAELKINLKQALYDVTGIAAVRYPKGGELPGAEEYVPDYKPYSLLSAVDAEVLLVTYGRLYFHVQEAADQLTREGTAVSVLKITRIAPLDDDCIALAMPFKRVIFFEEGSRSGGVAERFGVQLMQDQFTGSYEIHAIEQFLSACTVDSGLQRVGLDVDGILHAVRQTPHAVRQTGEHDGAE